MASQITKRQAIEPNLQVISDLLPRLHDELCPCGNGYKVPGGSALCNACRKEKRAETQGISEQPKCSGCDHVLTTENHNPKYKRCNKCIARKKPDHTICGLYDDEGDKCLEETFNETPFCKKHYDEFQSLKKEYFSLLDSGKNFFNSLI